MFVFIQSLIRDIRYAIGTLTKSPGFTVVAVLTFGLGVGATTSIFSVVDTILLRPLPYKDADRLMTVWETNPQKGLKQFSASGPNFVDWKSQSSNFEQMSAYQLTTQSLMNVAEPERLRVALVTANIFETLKARAAIGRTFVEGEDSSAGSNVAVLSHELWRRHFGGDPQIEGRAITLSNRSYTVIGIMPAEFEFPTDTQKAAVWLPLNVGDNHERGSHIIQVIGRLKQGVTEQQAQTELDTISSRLEQQYPASNAGWRTRVISLHENLVKDVKQSLYLLFGAVGFVLLIACVNVANLLLAKAATREREMSIRAALGAGRGRLIRQLLTESVLLALLGSLFGLVLAYLIINLLLALSPADIPRLKEAHIVDYRVLSFSLLVSVITGMAFGLAPALQLSRQNLSQALKEGVRVAANAYHSRARNLLVISEVAAAVVLLAASGLLVKSLMRLQEVDLGFKPDNILTAQVALPDYRYTEESQWVTAFKQILERVEHIPGVQSVGAISSLPLSGDKLIFDFTREGQPSEPSGAKSSASFRVVDSKFFPTMNIRLINGRYFEDRDTAEAAKVVIINETMAKRYWPQENPVGKQVTIKYGQPVPREIVGVVDDTKQAALDAETQAEIYVPYTQTPLPFMSIVARTSGVEPASLIPSVRSQVLAVDKDLPLNRPKSMQEVVSASFGQSRFRTVVLVIFAALALLLAMLGIYGVLSYLINERRREIGIRMALGAQRSNIIKLVVSQGMLLTLLGLGIGLLITYGLSFVVASLLYGVSSTDPTIFSLASILLAGTAMLACYIPARRASKISPMMAIRSD